MKTHWSFLSSSKSTALESSAFSARWRAMVEKSIGPISPKQHPTASGKAGDFIILCMLKQGPTLKVAINTN